jgi:signal transduction histidine kinase
VAIAEQRLEEEYRIAELREQFIAILGHDLRNPVGAISSSAQLLQRMGLEPRATRLANIIKDSSYRMNGLIENILDFARGRLGDGIKIEYDNGCTKESLNQVITELQSIWTDRVIEANLDFSDPVECDAKRVAQLFSNILGNALTHGDPAKKVIVDARVENNEFYLSVSNEGDKIPEHVMANIFQPFSRESGDNHQQGLGLGLFIASEIANAHGGTLSVVSDEQETCFTLRIPAQKA